MSQPDNNLTRDIVNHSALTVKDLTNTLLIYLTSISIQSAEQAYEEYALCKPALARLYEEDLGAFALISRKVKERLNIPLHITTADIERLAPKADAGKVPKPTKVHYLARFPELVDLVDEKGEVRFLVRGDNGAGLRLESQWGIDGQLYVPPSRALLPWLLPRAEQVRAAYETDDPASLFADLVSYYESLVELPSPAHYKLLGTITFHSYTPDFPEVTHSPELVLYAVAERGKSRTGKAITYAAMRGLRTETLREANIFRWSEDLGATLFFDVMNLWKKAERERAEDILLNRFEKGTKAARVLYPEKGRFEDTRYFDIFGATIIATNEPVHKILDTRCLTISMPPAKRRFDTEPTPELGLPLRERLLAWRAHRMGKPLPELEKAHSGRLGDITLPLLQVIRLVAPQEEENLRQLFAGMETDRLNEKSRSLEGDILAALLKLEGEVVNGKVPLKRLAEKLNEERPEKKEAVTPRFIAPRLRSLGFQLTTRNPADIVWNPELLQSCLVAYGIIDSPRTLETSSQSSQSSQNPCQKRPKNRRFLRALRLLRLLRGKIEGAEEEKTKRSRPTPATRPGSTGQPGSREPLSCCVARGREEVTVQDNRLIPLWRAGGGRLAE